MLNGRSRSNHGEKVMYSIWDTSSFWAIEVDIFVFEAELIPSTIKQRTENPTTKVSLGSARQFIPDKDSPDERSYLRTVDDLRGPCFAWWWSLSCKVGLQFVEFRRTMKTKSGLFTDGWTQKAATKFSQFFHTSMSVLVRWLRVNLIRKFWKARSGINSTTTSDVKNALSDVIRSKAFVCFFRDTSSAPKKQMLFPES